MEVILLERVSKLGSLGDAVAVKSGYARNYLIPYGKAVSATSTNKAEFEARRAELQQQADSKRADADKRAAGLADLTVTIAVNAGEEGKLYGSIGTRDIAVAITEAGQAVDKSEIRLPEGAIRALGEFSIDVQLHSDVVVAVQLAVIPE